MTVRPAKTQISLGIRPVWSESSLSAWRKLGSLATHWAHSEDSDQTGRMPRFIWVFADQTGRMPRLICLRWPNTNFVCFVMFRLTCVFVWSLTTQRLGKKIFYLYLTITYSNKISINILKVTAHIIFIIKIETACRIVSCKWISQLG